MYNLNKRSKSIPYYLKKLIAIAESRVQNNGIRAYWWNAVPNAGDLIVPLLLRQYGLTPIHTPKSYADLISCGSVLQNVPEDFEGTILGSGILTPSIEVYLPKANILALRGELTRDWIKAPSDVPLGDPGLLASSLIKTPVDKHYKVGIVPHYLDKGTPNIDQLFQKNKKEVLLIDIQRHPIKVLKDIAQCDYIFSTALHGLIFADALGIPSVWLTLDENPSYAKKFKYLDYYSAFQESRQPYYLTNNTELSELIAQAYYSSPSKIQQVKQRLDSLFLNINQQNKRSHKE